jgi:hypothetical protein
MIMWMPNMTGIRIFHLPVCPGAKRYAVLSPIIPAVKIQTRYPPFLALAIQALLFALWAGLVRMGWVLPSMPGLSIEHGPLMVCGFLNKRKEFRIWLKNGQTMRGEFTNVPMANGERKSPSMAGA